MLRRLLLTQEARKLDMIKELDYRSFTLVKKQGIQWIHFLSVFVFLEQCCQKPCR